MLRGHDLLRTRGVTGQIGGGTVSYTSIAYRLPRFLRRHILHFEVEIEEAVERFARQLPDRAHVLDAGSGEAQYAGRFARHRYTGVDLAVGDAGWDYSKLDAVADLCALPFATGTFDAAIHIVTIEHLPEPGRALEEIARTLKADAVLLIAAPLEWEVHQAPHDYFRYTRHGLEYLLDRAGMQVLELRPAAAQRATILCRWPALAIVSTGRNSPGPPGADSAVPRLS